MSGDRGADVIDLVPVIRQRAGTATPRPVRQLSRIIVLPPGPSGDDPAPPAA